MPEFRIESAPSRTLKSDKVVYYVRSRSTNKVVTKFDTSVVKCEEIEGWETFTATEKLELQSYLSGIRFTVDTLHLPAKLNGDYRFTLSEPLQVALVPLCEKAKANNISFNPMSAMLSSLLNHVASTDKRLQAVGEPSILESLGIFLAEDNKEELQKETRKITKKIFKRLQSLPGCLERYSKTAFELYGNDTNLNSATLLKYVEGTSKPSQWSISCALSVLGDKEDLSVIVPLSLMIELWLTPLKFSEKVKTAEQAFSLFKQYFKHAEDFYSEARHFIQEIMNESIERKDYANKKYG